MLTNTIQSQHKSTKVWKEKRIKSLINNIENGKWGTEPNEDKHDIPVVRIADFDRSNNIIEEQNFVIRNIKTDTQSLIDKKNDVLIEKSGGGDKTPVGQAVILESNQTVTFTNFITKLSVNTNVIKLKYFNYVLSNLYQSGLIWKHIKQTTGIQNLDINSYLNEKVLIPSIAEQSIIIEKLDQIMLSIKIIINKTKESIEELKKYKQSLITEAVTKGLVPNVDLKDSGIEWIKRIPNNWSPIKIKYLLFEKNERSKTGREEPLSMSQKYGIIPSNKMDLIPNSASNYTGYRIVNKEDLVFNKLKAHLGVFDVSNYTGIVSPDYAVYRARENLLIHYFRYLFRTPIMITEFIKSSRGVGAGLTRLYTKEFFNIKIPLPKLKEQQQIVTYLDEQTSRIDKLIEDKTKVIEELENYKKSLIYEYVTGKKEV